MNEVIEFTQFLRPDGRKRKLTFTRPGEITIMARSIKSFGGSLEAEILTTDEVSLTVNYKDEDIAIEIVPNGPDVLKAVDQLIRNAFHIILVDNCLEKQ